MQGYLSKVKLASSLFRFNVITRRSGNNRFIILCNNDYYGRAQHRNVVSGVWYNFLLEGFKRGYHSSKNSNVLNAIFLLRTNGLAKLFVFLPFFQKNIVFLHFLRLQKYVMFKTLKCAE